ncbi:hypothetical protein Syun_005716 [Stephania yunnanensis]|uniref:Uncharacterized protein n=1 Tax=Stephania yunnanensis TaxID=152371 RepID=A0AAP0KXW4_9MAGN
MDLSSLTQTNIRFMAGVSQILTETNYQIAMAVAYNTTKVHNHWLLSSDGESEMLQSCVIKYSKSLVNDTILNGVPDDGT